jgi:hypothetical protein
MHNVESAIQADDGSVAACEKGIFSEPEESVMRRVPVGF